MVLYAMGDAARALPLLERALAIFKARLPAGHPRLDLVRNNLAAVGPRLP
jgi:hypothetical protein